MAMDPDDEEETISGDLHPGTAITSGGDQVLPDEDVEEQNDVLLNAVKSREDDGHLFDVVVEEVAKEAFRFKKLRSVARDDLTKAIMTEKRINALEKVSKLVTGRRKEIKDRSGAKVDFHSEEFGRVLKVLTELILDAVKDTGMADATRERFLIKLQQKLTGFEDVAERAYKGLDAKEASQNAQEFSKTRGD